MEHNDDIQKDKLQETAPNLVSSGKENPFDVPENYFEKLSSHISDKCIQSEKPESARIIKGSFQKVFIPLAVAASIIFIILITHRKHENKIINSDQFAYTENSSTSDYLVNLIDNNELDETLIISELINDDTSKTISTSNQTDENLNSLNENPVIIADSTSNIKITEDDIIQYLLEEDESDDLLN